ncbi:hypothetical protein DM01DRAFT_1335087 [Hesseltinella vesiculosa]|uniref:Prefoldin n=1 Tax=Hesseltinella vesiculosa TaxID=101127 RepID=A0A1X2GK52_9FUNG|nr:hypothetical protein DM01DRAFT_1335087 [Hesseltinella vesiculosa]
MSNIAGEQIEKIFTEQEHWKDRILLNKQALVDLEEKQHANREGLAAMDQMGPNDRKQWLVVGDMFVRLTKEDAKKAILQDQVQLHTQTESARSIVRESTKKLQELNDKIVKEQSD